MTEPTRKRRTRKQTMTEWIRLVATPLDKAMLAEVTKRSGDDTESATVRRLIRVEHARLSAAQPHSEQAA
jgi:hypothetical protein